MLKIRNQRTGEVAILSDDVRDNHPGWVHEQLETNSESDLQLFLGCCSISEFAENAGKEDSAGVFMSEKDAAEYLEN